MDLQKQIDDILEKELKDMNDFESGKTNTIELDKYNNELNKIFESGANK